MPSTRVFVLLGLTTLLGVVGVASEGWARLALALDVAILAAFAVDLARVRRVEISAEREWPRMLVQGGETDLGVRLLSSATRRVRVRLRETLHPGVSSAPAHAELVLSAGGGRFWRFAVRPRRRGEHEVGPLMARLLGPWGLAWTQRRLLDGERRRVYPQVRWEGKVGHLLLLAHRRALGGNPQKMRGVGREPYALREYLPGDALAKIHWKASARHGRLVSREETWERGARLVILLDCARGMSGLCDVGADVAAGRQTAQESGEEGRAARSKLDHALAAALALTRVASARGDQVTLVAFSDRVERTVRLRGGARGASVAYGSLYDLEPRLAEPAFDVAAETAAQLESRRSTVVLFTSVVDLAAAELLRRAVLRLERRHRPILINLEDPELRRLSQAAPESTEDAFAQVATLDILLANRRLGTRLRHAGIRVVHTDADRLALAALESYLALFR